MRLSDNVCILVSDLNQNVYENPETLFAKPVNKNLQQLSITSSIEPFKYAEGIRRISTQSLYMSKKQAQRFVPHALKKPSCLVVGQLR